MKLSLKQQKFADEYIRTGNIYQSAINAGYSHNYANKNGSKMLGKVGIKSYIDARLEEIKKDSIADQDEILQYLTSVFRGETKEQTLIGVGDGAQEIESIDVSAKDRIKAAELLGKRYMMWTDKQQVEHTGAVVFNDDID
ncbi:terminase small subunit [Staphylococcus americanisciuri]|uniref:Terminase small subunit n=1 Tax=Staphylococcus americanisciuri TaxID=2973940 RepID=A0ABT2F421_9STAP|nr:terminase small subunit [Staphylococcus americanisciuri]MCS4487203.1 terminase small subunit [Staphylococcus americanisciuri]